MKVLVLPSVLIVVLSAILETSVLMEWFVPMP